MPLNLPELDDRRYTDLVEEARSLITTYAPQWTNHNPSDPGITLIEMFAYHTEMLIYRLNRVTDANKRKFLKLLKGKDAWDSFVKDNWQNDEENLTGDDLKKEIQNTVLQFRTVDRAVTAADFENIAAAADLNVARVRCVPRRDLTSANLLERTTENPGHVSVIIVPRPMFDFIGLQTSSSLIDHTTDAGFGSNLGFKLISNSSEQLYVGHNQPFGEIQFLFSQTGSGYLLKFEYYNGSGWKDLTQMGLNDFTVNWTISGSVKFNTPNDWKPYAVDSNKINRYWVRISKQSIGDSFVPVKAVRIFPSVPQPDDVMFSNVRSALDARRLLTTVVHVVGPLYLRIHVRLTIVITSDSKINDVKNLVIETLWNFFSPLTGGRDGKGWPFGQSVYVSDIYGLLDSVPGVDFVCRCRDNGNELDEIVIENASASRAEQNEKHKLELIKLYENEIIDITFPSSDGLKVGTMDDYLKGII